MALKRQLGLGLVLILGLQSCGKDKETKVVEDPKVAEENGELKKRVVELEMELKKKLQLDEDNAKFKADLETAATAKKNQEQLLLFAHAQSIVEPTKLLAALDRKIAAAQDDGEKTRLVELKNFYRSILPEGGDVALYCSKLIALAVEKGLITSDQGHGFTLEGSAPVFENQRDINSRLVGVAPCEAAYSALFE